MQYNGRSLFRFEWLIAIFFGLLLAVHGEPSERLPVLKKELGQSDTPEVFRSLEDCIFEDGTNLSEVLARLAEAEEVIRNLSGESEHHLRMVRVGERLTREYPDSWQAWEMRAGLVIDLPKRAVLREGEWVRATGWAYGGPNYEAHDRILALRHLAQARRLAEKGHQAGTVSDDDLADLYLLIVDRYESVSQKTLNEKTDTTSLPEPSPTTWGDRRHSLMMDREGKLLVPRLPASPEAARNDVEVRYWYYHRALSLAQKSRPEARFALAYFWKELYGIDNVAAHGFVYLEGTESGDDPDAPGELELHTLKDEETFVVGPDGPRRVTLPEPCRFLPILLDLANDETLSDDFRWKVAKELIETSLADRRQFDRIVDLVKKMGTRTELRNGKKVEIDLMPWGLEREDFRLDGGGSHPHGSKPKIHFDSRGLQQVELELWQIPVGPNSPSEFGGIEGFLVGERSVYDESHIPDDRRFERELLAREGRKLKTWSVPVRTKSGLRQSRTVVELPVSEPGHYLVVRRGDKVTEYLPVQLYDVAVVSGGLIDRERFNHDEGSFFVVDPVSGEPLEGVEVMGFQGDFDAWKVFEDRQYAVSDHHGRVEGIDGRHWCLYRRPGSSWQMLQWYRSRGEQLWKDNKLQSFLVTDRPLYRPGQKVSLAGWLRPVPLAATAGRMLPTDFPVRVLVDDPVGRQVAVIETRLNDFGGFEGAFDLGDELVLGEYQVRLDGGWPDLDPFREETKYHWKSLGRANEWTFEVGEFRKPDFQVAVELVEDGDGFEALVKASYLSGEPVKQAAVLAEMKGWPGVDRFYPRRKWDDLFYRGYQWGLPVPLQFEGWEDWAMWSDSQWDFGDLLDYNSSDHQVVDRQEVVTDDKGEARLVFTSDFPFLERFLYDVTLRVGVTEFTGRRVGAQKSFLHTGRPFEVFVRPLRGFYRVGEEVELELGVVTRKSEPRSGRGVLTIERIAGERFEKVFEKEIEIDASGLSRFVYAPKTAGQYRVLFSGGGSRRGFVLEVVGEEGSPGKYGGVQVIPRDFMVTPGESTQLLIRTDEPATTVWLFESFPDGIQRSPRVVRTENHTAVIDYRVLPSAQPNLILEVLAFRGGQPRRGRCVLLAPDEDSRLEVDMTLDRETARPGGRAVVDLQVRDAKREGMEAALALTVFDRALEELAGPLPSVSRLRKQFQDSGGIDSSMGRSPEGFVLFGLLDEPGVFGDWYGLEGTVKHGRESRFVKVGKELWVGYSPPELPNQVGGGLGGRTGGGGGMGFPVTPANPRSSPQAAGPASLDDEAFGLLAGTGLRSRFTDQAYWGGALRTGKDGRLRVPFDLPENLTAWRVQSWAFGKGRSFGEAKTELPVTKELQVRPLLPRAAVVGDELVVGAMIQNLSANDGTFVLTLETSGARIGDPGAREIALTAGGEAVAHWRVALESAEGAVFRVKAVSRDGTLSDGFESRLPVTAREVPRTVSDLAAMKKGQRISELRLPYDPAMKGRIIHLRGEADPAVSALKVLPDLVQYPHGCVEQTLNRFLPLLVAREAADQLGLDWEKMVRLSRVRGPSMGWISGRMGAELARTETDLSAVRVRDLVHVGVHRLAELQNDDGSWGWFSGEDPHARVYLTALAVRGLARAGQQAEWTKTGRSPLAAGMSWLESWSRRDFPATLPTDQLAEAAMAAWGLQEAGSDDASRLVEKLWLVREALPLTSQMHLALATGEKEKRKELLEHIRRQMTALAKEPKRFFKWWEEPVERRATYLKLLVAAGAGEEEVRGGIQQLLDDRTDGIRWKSTRESGLCVEAIVQAMTSLSSDPFGSRNPVELEVKANGRRHLLTLAEKDLWSGRIELPVENVTPVKGDEIVFEITRRGDSDAPVFLNASITYPSPDVAAMVAKKSGMALERRYFRIEPDGRRTLLAPEEKLRAGEIIEVELEILADDELDFLHLRDPIPAGLEPLLPLSGYRDGAYQESRTGESHFFISSLFRWNGIQRYRLSVVTAGSSLALPARVECMYSPETHGQSAARLWKVE